MEAAALRFTIATILLLFITRVFRLEPGPRHRKQRLWLAAAGVLNGIGYALVYRGEESVSGGLAAVLFGTMPLITALVAHVSRVEAVRAGHIVGSLLSLAGIAVIFGDRLQASADQAVGVLLIALSVITSSLYTVLLKRHGHDVHPMRSAAIFLAVTSLVSWSISILSGLEPLPWPPPLLPTVALLYLAIMGSVITFASYLYLLKRVSLRTVMTLVFMQPTIALFVDSMWEREIQLTAHSYLGIGITMAGVLVSVWINRRRGPAASR